MLPNFFYQKQETERSVKFIDRSTGVIHSYLWDFGYSTAGNPTTSTDINPTTTFPEFGFYKVKLQISDNATPVNSASIVQELIVHTNGQLGSSIWSFLEMELPAGINLKAQQVDHFIRTWQIYIQPQTTVPADKVYNQEYYSVEVNILIARLVMLDILIASLKSSGLKNRGDVKKMETGPANAEFYGLSDYWKTLFSDKPYEQFLQSTCMYASHAKIRIPLCAGLKKTHVFQVYKP